MDTKHALTIGVVLLVGVGVLAVLGLFFYTPVAQEPAPQEEHEEQEATPITFNSTELGLMFVYPGTYTLQTHEIGNDERMWTALTLIDTEILQQALENGASEGPPAIAIQVFDNVEEYTLEEWIKGTSYSNYKLAIIDDTLTPTTVGGEEALAYRYSGLFETNAVVVARGDTMYMFSADWLTPEDKNIRDFELLLETVSLY